ncbi:type II secretion system protein N [Pseudorhodoferax sp.]|uniref:type II secretion system protein N n=1 Tax=Pseudorhodoferax sp. TaxID=1993553 RepID=UPI002DD68415|nr:type II secretion system protein N [Pseudorhodoferax sp.]
MLRNAPAPSSTRAASPWPARLVTLLVWGLAALSATFWALRLLGPSGDAAPVPVARAALAQADATAVARVLGATPQVAASPVLATGNRYVLTGVVADRRQGGAALIAVAGQAPKPFRVGAEIEPGVRLASVGARKAVLAGGAGGDPLATLELPPIIRE